MNRVVMGSVLIGLATMYMPVSAMEFGQVRIRSGLDQPLLAAVPLRPRQAGELDGIKVSLASAAEFSHAGLDAGLAGLPLQFSLRDLGGGRRELQISSPQPLSRPYLDVLLALDGPHGRSLHELPIVLAPGARPASQAAGAKAAVARPDPRPQHTLVQAGQTLSAIAQEHRSPGISLDQMMLAYQQANPQAFYAGNISALKAGAILRVPTRAEAEAVSRAAAFQAVHQQNLDWHAGRPGRPSQLANAAAPAPVARPRPPAAGDRLALLAGKGQPSAAQQGSLAQEALRTSQQQAAELNSRIHDLQVMQQERDRLISLKSQQIAQLQQQLQAAQAASPTVAAAAAPPSAASARPAGVPAGAGSAHDGRWIWGGLAAVIVAALALLAASRRRGSTAAEPPTAAVAEPPKASEPPISVAPAADTEHELARVNRRLQQEPDNIGLYFELASLYYARHDVAHFVATAENMHARLVRPDDADWLEVQAMGRDLLPAHPLFAAAAPKPAAAPATVAASYAAIQATPVVEAEPAVAAMASGSAAEPDKDPVVRPEPAVEPVLTPPPVVAEPAPPSRAAAAPAPADGGADPVDTKLDLARAYLDMQEPASARAMLEEVLAEGSQIQQDVARQLLDGLTRA